MFAAIFNADRAPIDDRLLKGEGFEVERPAPHVALLSLSSGSPIDDETFIESRGGRLWIAGRLRLDRRAELAATLGVAASSDAMLCLAAYDKWGEAFVERIAGDFCFALWDARRERLTVARDQFGVRALFHATIGGSFVVSDRLPWLAACPAADRTLDETWIADFLGLGFSLDFDRTVWRAIRRLRPGHLMSVGADGATARCYWRLTVDEPLHYRDRRLYGERFRELTSRAIADRLPAGRVGVSLSGGLDSTTLAALAVELAGSARVMADSVHFASLMPDGETRFSTLVARQLGIAQRITAIDDLVYDPAWRTRGIHTAEPTSTIVHAHPDRLLNRIMAADAGVWLYGEGPDNALKFERGPYFSWLAAQRRWGELARASWLYLRAKGWSDWRSTLRRYAPQAPTTEDEPALPAWLDPGLVARTGLVERQRVLLGGLGATPHPWHPAAVASFEHPVWQRQFASFDGDEQLAPFVWRHPYVDLRVLHFLLSVPPVPWARRKLLMREAMRGRLPEAVLVREKTPLARYPTGAAIERQGLLPLPADHRLAGWVDVGRLPAGPTPDADIDRVVAVHALDHWLAG